MYLAMGSSGLLGPMFHMQAHLSLDPLARYLPSEIRIGNSTSCQSTKSKSYFRCKVLTRSYEQELMLIWYLGLLRDG